MVTLQQRALCRGTENLQFLPAVAKKCREFMVRSSRPPMTELRGGRRRKRQAPRKAEEGTGVPLAGNRLQPQSQLQSPAASRASSWRDAPGAGASGLPSALPLVCVPGCVALSCSSTVAGAEGGSLSVQCQYAEKYRTFSEYWCRQQPCPPLWQEIVENGGSEGEARSGRVAITDRAGDLTSTVTLENLTADDQGKYRSGIATILREEDGLHGLPPEPFLQVQVLASSASRTENSTGTPGSSRSTRPSQRQGSWLGSIHFLPLVFLKAPLLLSMLAAVLWVHRPQRAPWTESA
ncbi:LOW QUALITY PROTEIN: protein CD300H [Microcebus murinus]|uniref:LOW QUALITY PROTEIN: protein CD300H n=1 Tax=Microcebus murinus TaxID=30608 RepID=UPI003F6A83C4